MTRQCAVMGQIPVLIGERDDVDAAASRQMLQQIEAPDLVAAIGRKRDPVDDEQDLAHQPRPDAISGPARLAIQSGSFRHSATCIR